MAWNIGSRAHAMHVLTKTLACLTQGAVHWHGAEAFGASEAWRCRKPGRGFCHMISYLSVGGSEQLLQQPLL